MRDLREGDARVLHVIPTLGIGGAERSLVQLATGLTDYHHTILTLLPQAELADMVRASGGHVEEHCLRNLQGIVRLVSQLREPSFDIIHAWMYHAIVVAMLFRRKRTATVLGIRRALEAGVRDSRSTRRMVGLSARLSHRSSAIVYVSERAMAHHRERGFRARREVVIPNGVDTDRFRPSTDARQRMRQAWGFGPEDIVLIAVGRNDSVKNFAGLIAAFSRLHGRAAWTKLVIAGPGIHALQSTVGGASAGRDSELSASVRLLDDVNEIETVYQAGDIFVQSSLSEGFPNALAEAMAVGLPCVATDVGDTRRLMGSVDAASLVAPGDTDALVQAMRRWSDVQAHTRERAGRCLRAIIERDFSVARFYAAYRDLYADVLASRSGAGQARTNNRM